MLESISGFSLNASLKHSSALSGMSSLLNNKPFIKYGNGSYGFSLIALLTNSKASSFFPNSKYACAFRSIICKVPSSFKLIIL